MMISLSSCNIQVESPVTVTFPGGGGGGGGGSSLLSIDPFISWRRKDKVVIVMGATGTGKSRLSIDIATRFPAEIINSDKMQVYKGLDIVTNKITQKECQEIPHHLLGMIDPNQDFTATDFQHHALNAVESIVQKGKLPIIAGGSNSYIKSLVHDNIKFQSNYDCCFLWVDVAMPVLNTFVSERVNRMVQSGLVDEVRRFFDPDSDYTRGIKRAIGVPEMDEFFRNIGINNIDEETKRKLFSIAIEKIKTNTYKLACCQLEKIQKFRDEMGWNIHQIDATKVFMKHGVEADECWETSVVGPSVMIVDRFLKEDYDFCMSTLSAAPASSSVITAASVLGATLSVPVTAAVSH